jgi:transcriptional regulator with XRE-family HTH domain
MSLADRLATSLQQAERDPDYWLDIAVSDFTRELHARMHEIGVSQGELARRMGTSRPYVTKLLSGSNFTLQTMVKIAMALDGVVRIKLEGNETRAAQRRRAAAATANPAVVVDLEAARAPGPAVDTRSEPAKKQMSRRR